MRLVLFLFLLVLLIAFLVCISVHTKGAVRVTRTAENVHRYRNYGVRRTGREPEYWHYSDGGLGLALKYTIDGKTVCGVLDPAFTMSEAELRRIVEAGEETEIVTDPDDPCRFCLLREFCSSGPSERVLETHRNAISTFKLTYGVAKIAVFLAMLLVGTFLVWCFLSQFVR